MRRLSPALGVADLDRRAAPLGQGLLERLTRDAARDHDLRRDRRRGGVVLEHELLGDLGLVALGLVVEVEALPVGEHAVADLEDLRVGVGPLGGDRDRVERADRRVRDALALEQRAHRLQPVAVGGGLLELLLGRGRVHRLLEVALDLAVAAREEGHDRVDRLAVLLRADVADAGRAAALDEVVEARAAGRAARLHPVAAAVLEDLAEQVERLTHPLGVRERPEVRAPAPVLLAREVDPREVLVQRDPDVGVRLVVAQPDVVARPVLADEVLLGEQRLRLGLGGDELDVRDLVEHPRGALACSGSRSATRPAS